MSRISRMIGAAAVLAAISAPAIAQTQERAPVAMRSAKKMTQDKPASESWTYIDPAFRSSRFSALCVLPTKIYSGPDSQFPGTSAEDKQKYADILTREVREVLGKSFTVAPASQPGCLNMQLTLVGLENTTGGVATASRMSVMGFAFSTLNSIRGKSGSFTGSMLIAMELTGGRKDDVLVAAVRRRSPDALDIPATISMTETVKAIADDFAGELRDRLTASGVLAPTR